VLCQQVSNEMKSALDNDYRSSLWPLPPRLYTAEGAARRVGVELEFSGIRLEQIANLIREQLGGELDTVSPYESLVRGTELGDFKVELDSAWLKRRGREQADVAPDELAMLGENMLKLAAEQLVPFEVVSPPIVMSELWRLGSLLQVLQRSGARGTADAPHYAFGLHLNPELPGLDASTILAYLRAFSCLSDWLRMRSKVNLSRRITPYIDPYDKAYVSRLLAPDYAPDEQQLVTDYLAANPTRNRALDMLPLFSHLDKERVREAIPDDRVSSRPTLHYRLPNCEIDDPNWSLARPWRDWLQVDALACDPARLEAAMSRYREHLGGFSGGLFGDWTQASAEFLLPELC
jgi:hypothetical protein|tara:strand:+ start:7108 stop:8151 length:1044 start_codon:yes stop_codon:yes gene_type:complete